MNLSRDLKVAGMAAKLAGVRRIIYRRGSAIPIKNSIMNRYYFKSVVTDILANSIATKKTVLENNPNLFPEEKIKVIYNGINVKDFSEHVYLPFYTKQKNEIVLCSLGRLEFEKNHKFLIVVAQELKLRNINFKLIIGGDGRLKEMLETLTQNLNVTQEVMFPGFIKNPKDLLYTSDIFLLSSLWEGFGYVLAEAALCKKPIVAFDVASIPEVVINNETGFLTPLNDVHLFADKIEYLYNNPEIRKEMGSKGYNFAINTFDSTKTQTAIAKYLIDA
jgi:glycosyltransferase involved in cell wall biosynthesis